RDVARRPCANPMIQLRHRQVVFVERCVRALREHRNTLGVAPTGAGKTIMISEIIARLAPSFAEPRIAVLAHRHELTQQNIIKFTKTHANLKTSLFTADTKSWRGPVI